MCFYCVLTVSGVSKLPTGNASVRCIPDVVTYCTPLLVKTHLHTTFVLICTLNKANVSSFTDCKKYNLNKALILPSLQEFNVEVKQHVMQFCTCTHFSIIMETYFLGR